MQKNQDADNERDYQLKNLGIKVLRYSNFDVNNNFNVVCEDILKNLGLGVDDLLIHR